MKRLLITGLLLAAMVGMSSGYAQTLTLQQCVETAVKNNLQVNQAIYQSQTASINLKQAKDNLLPDLFGNLGHGINQGRNIDPFTNSYINQQVNYANAGINSSITVFNGGMLQNSIQQNRLLNQAATADVQQSKETITLNVILAYLQIINNTDLLEQANNQLIVTGKQVDRLDILNKAGAIVPALLYDLKGQYANDQLAVVNAQNSLNQSRLTLAQLMNIPYARVLSVEPVALNELSTTNITDAAEVIQTALQQLPIIKGVALRRQAAEKGIRVAKGNYFPLISFSTGLNTNFSNAARTETLVNMVDAPSGDFVNINGGKVPVITQRRITTQQSIGYFNQFKNNYGTSIFLNISIPLLNGFRAKNRVAQARADEKYAAFVEQTTRTQVSQTVEQASFNLNAATDRYNTLVKQVADFSESFRIAEVRFQAGAITQVDYLIAKNNTDRAKTNLIIAKYDFVFRSKILDYYQGKLVL